MVDKINPSDPLRRGWNILGWRVATKGFPISSIDWKWSGLGTNFFFSTLADSFMFYMCVSPSPWVFIHNWGWQFAFLFSLWIARFAEQKLVMEQNKMICKSLLLRFTCIQISVISFAPLLHSIGINRFLRWFKPIIIINRNETRNKCIEAF